ncbi:ankyrin repeat domain-containing protein [Mycobacterium sp. UM_Kg27]|uniref:ankyrin repeat domain-containing protein n=1 Tax=Mycobacterium sp. UM_Kg27 TaxID=1545693 RepID=UPI00061AA085|nr:ankyrin repeat domain-containing protein [Mycobacterium sp. UM_Kg27]
MDEPPIAWPGVLEPSLMSEETVTAGHKMADAAEAGDWPALFDLLDADPALSANQWRPGSTDWVSPLHQAARHGAPTKVVAALIERGALRSLRDARGWAARDVAFAHRHPIPLISLLIPPASPLSMERTRALDANLEWVIHGSVRAAGILDGHTDRDLHRVLRLPPVAVLHEAPGRSVQLVIPRIPGGIRVTLRADYLETAGAGQRHVITHRGAVLVAEDGAGTA